MHIICPWLLGILFYVLVFPIAYCQKWRPITSTTIVLQKTCHPIDQIYCNCLCFVCVYDKRKLRLYPVPARAVSSAARLVDRWVCKT